MSRSLPGARWSATRLPATCADARLTLVSDSAFGKMLPHNAMLLAKMYTPPLVRWGIAAGSVVFFLGHEDLPAILLETPYGVTTTWADVAKAAGLMKSE